MDKTLWPRVVRRYVYELIILIFLLGLIAAGYISWQGNTSDKIQRLGNDYHLANTSHYLKAMEKLHHMTSHLTYDLLKTNIDDEFQAPTMELGHEYNGSVYFHLIRQEIRTGLELQRSFADDRFDFLADRLERQLSIFEEHGEDYFLNGVTSNQMIPDIRGLMLPLKQLVRLHTIVRDDLLIELKTWEKRQTRVFILLVFVLLLAGFLITRRGLGAIDAIITERKQVEEKLQLAASVFSHAREGIAITDTVGTIIDVNNAFTRITGYPRDEALGQNLRIHKSGRHEPEFYAALWRDLVKKGYWHGEIRNRSKNGEVYTEMLTISAVRDDQGKTQHYVGLFSDITAQKTYQKRLEHIAHYDALTSLPNRVLLADRMHQAMVHVERQGQQLAVAYLDLDGFKDINDTYGHEVGDQLLIIAATRMKETLREVDTIARIGGDEFVAVLNILADAKASVQMLARLLDTTAQPVHIDNLVLRVSASIGVTFYPQAESVDADHLLRQADQAMYQAKLAGKNRYHVFDAEQDRSIRGHHESLDNIRRALTEHEFVLHYQPKVNMHTGEMIGVEALIRWQHPEQGLLRPHVFLPVIESNPLIIDLGEWVIDSALTQLEAWHTDGLNLSVSVNVNALQMQQDDFTRRLHELLATHPDVKPSLLELEVLETSALEDMERMSLVMRECSELGVRFALDDFGTGYSSLTYLKRLPAAQLKIDRSFVQGMLEDQEDLAIVEGVLGLAVAFRRQPVAEGVETVEHGELLLQLGCELAQGYGIARPMPADELQDWGRTWQPEPSWTSQQPVNRDDLPLVFASVEHRAWIHAIEEYLKGTRSAPPQLDHHRCRFGHWLEAEGRTRYGTQSAFQDIEQFHKKVHILAAELVELQSQTPNPEDVQARLVGLHGLRDTLLGHMKVLLHNSQRHA